VLGRKGCGKSALDMHLRLRSNQHNERFVQPIAVSELIASLPAEATERSIDLFIEWAFLLSLYASLSRDASILPHSTELTEVYQLLHGRGLLAPQRLKGRTSKRTQRFGSARSIYQATFEPRDGDLRTGPEASQYARRLRAELCASDTQNFHVIVLDGFEDQFTRAEDRSNAAQVVKVATRLNREFRQAGALIIVLILIRPDIFDELHELHQKAKIAWGAVRLEWFHQDGWASHTPIGKLIDRRAALALDRPVSVAEELLAWRSPRRTAHAELARYTRGTPRDVLMILRCLQESIGRYGATRRSLSLAIEQYSADYMVEEIRDELELHLPPGMATRAWSALRSARNEISLANLLEHCPEGVEPQTLLKLLYRCGAIGQRSGATSDTLKFQYSHPKHTPKWLEEFTAHPAVERALEL
jgi:hypothetical protein